MRTDVFEVVGRDHKRGAAWLRVKIKHGYKILTLEDSVLPHGMKTATHVRAEWSGNIESREVGYWAEVNVLEDVSDEFSGETADDD